MEKKIGVIQKMFITHDEQTNQAHYTLNLDGVPVVELNNLIGREVEISFLNKKKCLGCDKAIRGKTYSQGYCYQCFITLPQTDMCILKPEQCHYHQGTCRDSSWGEKYCFDTHYLYLANSSELKVGITRSLPTRWLDQGATEAVIIGEFPNRFEVGKAEKKLTEIFKDKTNWRNMLKGKTNEVNLFDQVAVAHNYLKEWWEEYLVVPKKSYKFIYPVLHYPEKVTSLKLDKCVFFKETLHGIKGQYLIFGNHVINLRAHGGYQIEFSY